MACGEEHLFVLDYAIKHCSWLPDDRFRYQGWRAGLKDKFNRLAILPDMVHDWLWQKLPYAPSVIAYGLQRVRCDFEAGKKLTTALKLALLSHYLHDIIAVSHTWLDFIGDEVDFTYDALRHFHDPVENRVAHLLPALVVPPPSRDGEFSAIFSQALSCAYELGKRVFDAYFDSLHQVAPEPATGALTPPLELIDEELKLGVVNACKAVWALWELGMVSEGENALSFDEADVRRWTLRSLLDSDAEAIEAVISEERLSERISEWQLQQGWHGSDIFHAHERCSEEALQEYQRWQAKRDEWRQSAMAGILPPRPKAQITRDWRPSKRQQ